MEGSGLPGIVDRYLRYIASGDPDDLEAFATPEMVDHVSGMVGEQIWPIVHRWMADSFAEPSVEVHEAMSNGDKVMVWLTARGRHVGDSFPQLAGRPITDRQADWSQVHIFRVGPDGRAVEHWAVRDDAGLLRQLFGPPT